MGDHETDDVRDNEQRRKRFSKNPDGVYQGSDIGDEHEEIIPSSTFQIENIGGLAISYNTKMLAVDFIKKYNDYHSLYGSKTSRVPNPARIEVEKTIDVVLEKFKRKLLEEVPELKKPQSRVFEAYKSQNEVIADIIDDISLKFSAPMAEGGKQYIKDNARGHAC